MSELPEGTHTEKLEKLDAATAPNRYYPLDQAFSNPQQTTFMTDFPLQLPGKEAEWRHELYTPEAQDGLQIRTSPQEGKFTDVVHGQYGDPDTKHLWTVDDGGLKIIPELYNTLIENPEPGAPERVPMKHTNPSPLAKIGGEVWFDPDGHTVHINPNSGRFGEGSRAFKDPRGDHGNALWDAAQDVWRSLGYDVDAHRDRL